MGDSIPGGNPIRQIRPPATPSAVPGAPASYVASSGHAVAKLASMPIKPTDDAPIELVDESDGDSANKIRALGSAANTRRSDFKRQTTVTGRGACRVRTFNARLSDEGLSYMDEKINEWLDRHPEIEVKFVTSTVGNVDGKIKELALVLNVWY